MSRSVNLHHFGFVSLYLGSEEMRKGPCLEMPIKSSHEFYAWRSLPALVGLPEAILRIYFDVLCFKRCQIIRERSVSRVIVSSDIKVDFK